MVYEFKCPRCSAVQTLDLDPARISEWRAGGLVQNVFPELAPDQRELLVTGLCCPCWEEVTREP